MSVEVLERGSSWLPVSEYEHAGKHDLELDNDRFHGDAESSEIDYFIPIRKR